MKAQPPGTRFFLSCGLLAGPLFVLVFLLEGATRPGYNPLRHPVSSLSIGEQGWMQVANFLISASLLFLFALGLHRLFDAPGKKFRGPLLVALAAAGLFGAGIFSSDAVYGYPEDRPLALAQFSLHGHLHDAFSMLLFVCLPWAIFVFRKQFKANGETRLAAYSLFAGTAMLLLFVFAAIGFKQVPAFVNYAGVFQRLCIAFGLSWPFVVSLSLIRNSNRK